MVAIGIFLWQRPCDLDEKNGLIFTLGKIEVES